MSVEAIVSIIRVLAGHSRDVQPGCPVFDLESVSLSLNEMTFLAKASCVLSDPKRGSGPTATACRALSPGLPSMAQDRPLLLAEHHLLACQVWLGTDRCCLQSTVSWPAKHGSGPTGAACRAPSPGLPSMARDRPLLVAEHHLLACQAWLGTDRCCLQSTVSWPAKHGSLHSVL